MNGDSIDLRDVAAIVVHHRSYDTLRVTVRDLISQGVPHERVIVVDNSEEPGLRSRLRQSLPDGVELTHVPNRGYGAAVNAGLDLLDSHVADQVSYVLVTTHEA